MKYMIVVIRAPHYEALDRRDTNISSLVKSLQNFLIKLGKTFTIFSNQMRLKQRQNVLITNAFFVLCLAITESSYLKNTFNILVKFCLKWKQAC